MRCAVAVMLSLALVLGACKGQPLAQRSRGARGAPPPYQLKPLVAALRPGVEREVRRQARLKTLTDLPYYEMQLTVVPHEARLEGRTVLYYKNRTGKALARLPLLLHPNSPKELGTTTPTGSLELTAAKSLSGPKVKLRPRRLTVTELVFARPLAPGKRVKLELKFSGRLRRLPPGSNDIFNQALASMGVSGAGMGASDYGLLAMGDGILTLASAYPMVAPHRGGKFDVSPPSRFGDLAYNSLANYRVTVTLPRGYLVVSNLKDGKPGPGKAQGTTAVTMAGAANRDLVLVAGQQLKQLSQKLGPVLVRSTFLAGDEQVGRLVLKTSHASLKLFQQRFGPYPYTELDTAEATLVGGAGGVEFPGMVLVAGMLYRKPSRSASPMGQLMKMLGNLGNLLGGSLSGGGPVPSASGMKMMDKMIRQMAEFTTAHEVAHQYFAGLVGADCRADPAVDEPLAQFAAGEYMIQAVGRTQGEALMNNNARLNYGLYRMLGGKDRPAAQPVTKFPSALSYAAIVYGKAPYFYRALRRKLGPARFNRALRRAVDRNRFKLVTTRGWIRDLERAAGGASSGVRPLAKRWLYQRHGDKDLKVDGSGDVVLGGILGRKPYQELKRNLALMGMRPADLFKMMMGNMMAGERN